MSDESENNQPPPVQEEKPADNAAPAEEKPADNAAPAEDKPADDAAPAEEKPADDAAPAEEKPADDAAPAEEKPADDAEKPVEENPADDAAPVEEKPADDAAPAEDKPADDAAPADKPPAEEEKPAAKEEETPAKKDAPKKEDKRRPSTSAQSEASTSRRRRSSAVAADPFEGLSAAERVRLGYDMAQKRFAQRRPSAGMISTTPRDPYRPLVKSASVTPQMRRRQEVEAARQAHFAQKSGYDPSKMLPPSTFDGKPNKDPKRSSSWTRDRTTRRPFAPSYDYVPSSRQAPTPGPGAYRDPLANYVGM